MLLEVPLPLDRFAFGAQIRIVKRKISSLNRGVGCRIESVAIAAIRVS